MSDDLARLLDATWPAAATWEVGPFTLREGAGGGKRVSAATAEGHVTEADIVAAETAMDDRGQQAMFAVRPDQGALDLMLAERSYLVLDPTRLHRSAIAALADVEVAPNIGFSAWPPLQVQRDIWSAGHVGAERLAVMARAAGPKTTILGRHGDTPAGTAFVAVHERIAVLHAIEVLKDDRRRGVARTLLIHAARWGRAQGADRLVALVTAANTASTSLFARSGFDAADAYHYRIRP